MRPLIAAMALMLVCATTVAGLTASPASYDTSIHSGTDTYGLTLTNDEKQLLNITLTPEGPLANYISVEPWLTLAPQAHQTIQVQLQLPEQTQPGVLESGILIESKPVGAGTVAAAAALLHAIRVITPKNGTYLSGNLLSSTGLLDQPVDLTVSITNTGTNPIQRAAALVRVANAVFNTETVSLAPGEVKNLVVEWTPKALGTYTATAQVEYDGQTTLLTTDVSVGNLSVSVLGLRPGSFTLGELFKVAVAARSDWMRPLETVASVSVIQHNTTVANATSTTATLLPLQQTSIPVFLDSQAMSAGPATLVVQIAYSGTSTTVTYPAQVFKRKLVVNPGPDLTLLVIAALLVAALALFMIFRRSYLKGKRINGVQGE